MFTGANTADRIKTTKIEEIVIKKVKVYDLPTIIEYHITNGAGYSDSRHKPENTNPITFEKLRLHLAYLEHSIEQFHDYCRRYDYPELFKDLEFSEQSS